MKMIGPDCREATRLTLLAEETELPLRQRLGLRFHLLICRACPKFVAQVALMRQASKRWRGYTEE